MRNAEEFGHGKRTAGGYERWGRSIFCLITAALRPTVQPAAPAPAEDLKKSGDRHDRADPDRFIANT
jgi:hypothetical protein